MKQNYFENCKSADELKATYKELVKKFHPDVFGEKGNEIMKEIHNQLEKALKKVDSKLYNELYNDSDREESEETRAKKEQIAQELLKKCGGLAYQYLFVYYLQNGLRPYNHRNPLTKHNFSGWNVWQLELQALIKGYKSSEWSTFAQYNQAKNGVGKGQKGTYITLAIISKGKDEEGNEDETKTKVYYKGYYVFNIEQTSGAKAPAQIETKQTESKQAVLNLWEQKYEVVA